MLLRVLFFKNFQRLKDFINVTKIFKSDEVKLKIFKEIIEKKGIVKAIPVKNTLSKPRSFFDNLNKHGVIIITEKIIIDEIDNNKFSKNFHDFFKENKGYSKEEIDRKKIALENVMLLESEKQYEKRFNEIGCTNFFKWIQCYNFISWVLVK